MNANELLRNKFDFIIFINIKNFMIYIHSYRTAINS